MARRLAASVCAVVLAAGPRLVLADAERRIDAQDPSADAKQHAPDPLNRWSIPAFVRDSARHSAVGAPLRYVPAAHTTRWYSSSSPTYTDTSAPMNRIKALKKLRVATLWRGRNSSLVLGLVDQRYFGVRLDARNPLAERGPEQP